MVNNEAFDIQGDSDLRDAVRTETQYDDADISTSDLDGLIDSAKRLLALRTDATSFYDDRGLAVALLGVTCGKAKGAVENEPVRVENIGPLDVTFRTTDGSSLQVEQYAEMTQMGLSHAASVDDAVQGIELTNTHYHDDNRVTTEPSLYDNR